MQRAFDGAFCHQISTILLLETGLRISSNSNESQNPWTVQIDCRLCWKPYVKLNPSTLFKLKQLSGIACFKDLYHLIAERGKRFH